MVSVDLVVAAGEREAALRTLAERAFLDAVFALRGLVLPPVAVRVDAALAPGRFAVVVNGERGPAQDGDIVARLLQVVGEQGAALIDDEGTRTLLDLLHDSHPVLVEAVCARFDLPFLRRRLQALLSERIPVTDLWTILESLLRVRGLQSTAPGTDEAALRLSEAGYDREVRHALRHAIAWPLLRQGRLAVHALNDSWRAALAAPLSAADVERLRQAVAAALGDATEAVLLTDDDTRATLRDLLAAVWPRVTVLGYGDLPPDFPIETLAPVE